jgi:hypothetical protein
MAQTHISKDPPGQRADFFAFGLLLIHKYRAIREILSKKKLFKTRQSKSPWLTAGFPMVGIV